ncbi:symmetrical bis(5'-nucleosyl)-tetraphosphatase [Spirochaeta africana]|uniref:Calcineurin-like phosphoesterase n=1 Tax=Spirochaeta africana (strain ATCC 700263 / DSM 8902 / Z-7692) TaxID=889378 RepID=H9UFG8_SPIAZ|nr:symmetrical bis(5'-nucleosyl)-tetraphosphatase [Spirochaeta africana]AFG36261.1 Calcineurin-like phosphoesterase [Spirochaeta africana DSM 8902]
MASYVVGDVHGRLETLRLLCKQLHFSPHRDRLLFVGDLVNRGPQSVETVAFVRNLGSAAESILGNHDLYLLACADGVLQPRGSDRFAEILQHPAAETTLAYLRRRPLLLTLRRPRTVVVHAGLPAFWSLPEVMARAAAVQLRLRSRLPARRVRLLSRTVRDGEISCPNRHHGPWHYLSLDQAAYTMNLLTGVRLIDPRGTVPLGSKAEQRAVETGGVRFRPWYQRYARHHARSRHAICFGHWASLGGLDQPPFYGLDTNCGGGDRLTARNLDTGELTSVACID